jgi:hypothetical protein
VKGESERRLLIVTLLATLTAGRLHGGRDPDYEDKYDSPGADDRSN